MQISDKSGSPDQCSSAATICFAAFFRLFRDAWASDFTSEIAAEVWEEAATRFIVVLFTHVSGNPVQADARLHYWKTKVNKQHLPICIEHCSLKDHQYVFAGFVLHHPTFGLISERLSEAFSRDIQPWGVHVWMLRRTACRLHSTDGGYCPLHKPNAGTDLREFGIFRHSVVLPFIHPWPAGCMCGVWWMRRLTFIHILKCYDCDSILELCVSSWNLSGSLFVFFCVHFVLCCLCIVL